MAKHKKSSRAGQPRLSKGLCQLRDAIALNPADWESLLHHLRDGLAQFERAAYLAENDEPPLELAYVPEEWLQDADALGYVTLRVLNKGRESLRTPVVQYFLRICDPGADAVLLPPGIGAAWLHLVKAGIAPPIDAARLSFMAAQSPREFFRDVAEDDLPLLSRTIVEANGTPEAWDLHVLLTAVHRAEIHVRAPYRLFHALMEADWLSQEVKREFCRGLLGCSPYAERLKGRVAEFTEIIASGGSFRGRFPLLWLEVAQYGTTIMLRGLKRHAVVALVEHAGELPLAVIKEFLFRDSRRREFQPESIDQGVLDVVQAHADELGPDAVRRLLAKAIRGGAADVRHAAYRIGLAKLGPAFARPALKDPAGSVRTWAAKALG